MLRFRQSLVQHRFKGSRAVSRCSVETRLTSALSVRTRHARMVTSCWAPVAKQYYATTTETRDLDTMGLEMKARGRKRLCCVKAEAPDVHSCGGLPPGVVWSMSDERRTHGRSEQRSLLLHCPWWPTSQSKLGRSKFVTSGFCPPSPRSWGLIVVVCVLRCFPANFRHARHGACSSCSAFSF